MSVVEKILLVLIWSAIIFLLLAGTIWLGEQIR